jgi:long-chain acyl-CoA synthetase
MIKVCPEAEANNKGAKIYFGFCESKLPHASRFIFEGENIMYTNLGQVMPHGAAKYDNRVALVFKGVEFTYNRLNDLSAKLANGLKGLGVEPGDRVTLYSQNRWEWIIGYYAVLRLGAVINPINVMLTPDEVVYVTKDCGAKVLLTSVDKGTPIIARQSETPLQHIILFGNELPAGAVSFNQLISENDSNLPELDIDPLAMSTIGYTSGTTGHPKGAMLSHQAIVLNSALTSNLHARTGDDICYTSLPCAHVYGNVVMNGAFFLGGKLVLHDRFEPAETMELIQTYGATVFDGVPTMYFFMLAQPDFDRFDLSSLRLCAVGGQTMPEPKMREVEDRFGCSLIELWGMTELGGLGTTFPAYGPNKHGSIGIQLPYVECRIADVEDANKTLPPDEVGELMVRGPIVMMGYFGNEEKTKETIEPDGWLHTGDVAQMDGEGCVYIVDRKKDMILTAGYNVYPAEIERVVAGHPAVALVAVGSMPDEMKGELAKAYIVLKEGINATEQEIIEFCRESLAAYKVPRLVQFVSDVPKTSTGKVMRRMLRTLDE